MLHERWNQQSVCEVALQSAHRTPPDFPLLPPVVVGKSHSPPHAVSPGIRMWGRLWLRQLLVLLLHLVPAFHHPPNVQFCFSVLVQWLKLHVCAHKCVYEQKQWQRHCHVSLVVLFTARYRISFSSFFFPPKLNCSNYSFRLTLGARRIATW